MLSLSDRLPRPMTLGALPEAAESERSLSPYLLQLIPDLLQGENKQYPRGSGFIAVLLHM